MQVEVWRLARGRIGEGRGGQERTTSGASVGGRQTGDRRKLGAGRVRVTRLPVNLYEGWEFGRWANIFCWASLGLLFILMYTY
jgi:hypothetical protein